jgi:hypothetical protein
MDESNDMDLKLLRAKLRRIEADARRERNRHTRINIDIEKISSEIDGVRLEEEGTSRVRIFKRRRLRRSLSELNDKRSRLQDEAAATRVVMNTADDEVKRTRSAIKEIIVINEIKERQRLDRLRNDEANTSELLEEQDQPADIAGFIQWLKQPSNIFGARSVRNDRGIVPQEPGIYAWYFRKYSLPIFEGKYVTVGSHQLFYIGITDSRDQPSSGGDLRSRLYSIHITGDTRRSSLRLNLGVLLQHSGAPIHLMKKGRDDYVWSDERWLTEWISENARVAWQPLDRPSYLESHTIKTLGHILPLNTQHNSRSPFAGTLARLMKMAKAGINTR